jgi:hypothetical protein
MARARLAGSPDWKEIVNRDYPQANKDLRGKCPNQQKLLTAWININANEALIQLTSIAAKLHHKRCIS